MVESGAISDPSHAFTEEWIAPGGRAWVSLELLPVAEGVAAIHAAGGAAVFAHPGTDAPSGAILLSAVREAAAAGLDGIEVDHPDHDDGALRASVEIASELGLIQTAGSDDHGVGMDGPRLGCRTVPARVVQQLRNAADRHRA
jgi:predicted metal-dependent phosphoesterase TrpH